MKIINLFLVFVMTLSFTALSNVYKTPELNIIKQTKLSTPYSCKGNYEKSAVFLSHFTKTLQMPDLQYDGECKSGPNYFQGSNQGDEFTLIADLGKVNLESVTPEKAFGNGEYNSFKRFAEVKLGHTYAVLSSKRFNRSLVIYKVVRHTLDGELILDYAVKNYSIQNPNKESIGFDWTAENVYDSSRSEQKNSLENEDNSVGTQGASAITE